MLEQLDRHFPKELRWNRPKGGFFVFVHLTENMNASELLAEAMAHNIVFVPGAPFFIDGSGHNTFRLSYSQVNEAVIESAVRELGNLINQHFVNLKKGSSNARVNPVRNSSGGH
jgi:2-aminoadipate transaminase